MLISLKQAQADLNALEDLINYVEDLLLDYQADIEPPTYDKLQEALKRAKEALGVK